MNKSVILVWSPKKYEKRVDTFLWMHSLSYTWLIVISVLNTVFEDWYCCNIAYNNPTTYSREGRLLAYINKISICTSLTISSLLFEGHSFFPPRKPVKYIHTTRNQNFEKVTVNRICQGLFFTFKHTKG